VIDYKTGKIDEEDNNDLQLVVYAMIMSHNMKVPVYKASYLYLQSNTLKSIDVTEDAYEKSINDIKKQVEKIKAEKEFAPKKNKNCKSCDYLEICPMKKEVLTP
jgi:radical SAM protein with 4Fe4S-binding SPASM domain